ncbi:hypothetical protein [Ornithinibacillus californiensis]|uniref:hypothetical protein n=1 Tax=Ornithinibacillus californiensis TaxID=161536 RepID=UPI00064DBFF4|nr:hypothetical protein [Ornithinibacillus californiensis]
MAVASFFEAKSGNAKVWVRFAKGYGDFAKVTSISAKVSPIYAKDYVNHPPIGSRHPFPKKTPHKKAHPMHPKQHFRILKHKNQHVIPISQ